MLFAATRACKPGSVLTAIYLALQLLIGSSRLPGTAGSACCPSTALLRDRVYIVKPMSPWAGWALTPPFHPYLAAVYLCCTCPEITLGGRYPLSLPCGARTFLIRGLSACVRGCPAWSRKYCTAYGQKSQMSCKIFWERIYYQYIKPSSLGEGGTAKAVTDEGNLHRFAENVVRRHCLRPPHPPRYARHLPPWGEDFGASNDRK